MNPEIAHFEALFKDGLRRCMADEDPESLRKWLTETLARMGSVGSDNANALLTWKESFDLMDALLEHYAKLATTPEVDRKTLSWPWKSWRDKIDPLEEGMLATLTAPDGTGKTIYAESIAEYWAEHKNKVVFVHYELNKKLMMLRRTARQCSFTSRQLKSGQLTPAELRRIAEMRPRMLAWDGYISYLHTPGWSMERTAAELRRLRAEDNCDVVVVDYVEKAAASRRQLQLFGSGGVWSREADNVEQLKTFAETSDCPVLMVAQMSKAGKDTKFKDLHRGAMKGAGEKADKANLVILLKLDRRAEGGYMQDVNVLIDKNTMGPTGTLKQFMEPEYFRVADLYNGPDVEPRPVELGFPDRWDN